MRAARDGRPAWGQGTRGAFPEMSAGWPAAAGHHFSSRARDSARTSRGHKLYWISAQGFTRIYLPLPSHKALNQPEERLNAEIRGKCKVKYNLLALEDGLEF